MITPYNILRHELTGLRVEIVEATHEGYMCKGKISDETRNTITIETNSGDKKLPKNCIVLKLDLPDETVVKLDGNLIISRPEDRIKKRYRIRFA